MESILKIEYELWKKNGLFSVGVDEAGRGPLAGPVVAVAATVRNFQIINSLPRRQAGKFQINAKNEKKWALIKDSKLLSEKQRESLFDFIHENFYIGVGICNHKTIDRINILEATYLAMKSAISQLKSKINLPTEQAGKFGMTKLNKFIILVDGNKKIPNLSLEQKAIVSGDKLVKSISAASIIAKVTRDRIMLEMDRAYPEYGFKKHKGYGTRLHMEKIKKHGPCKIHRVSFRPFSS